MYMYIYTDIYVYISTYTYIYIHTSTYVYERVRNLFVCNELKSRSHWLAVSVHVDHVVCVF